MTPELAAAKPTKAEAAAERIAERITKPGALAPAVSAVQDALAAGGVATVEAGAVVEQASLPAAPFTSRRIEAINLALEAQNRESVGRLTLADIADYMGRMGFPFAKGRSSGEHLVRFLRIWVRGARAGQTGKRAFAPLFLAAMAKRQRPAVSLAGGDYKARELRLTLLEVEILSAAFMRSARNGPAKAPAATRGRSAQAGEENCTNFKEYLKGENEKIFGEYAANVNRLLDLSVGVVSGFGAEKTLQLGIANMIIADRGGQVRYKAASKVAAKHAGRAMAIFGVLMRAQKLYAFYNSIQVRVTPLYTGASIHKPSNRVGADVFTDIAGFAGIQQDKLDEYRAEKAALHASERALEKGARDCAKAVGLPTLSDAGDIAGELEDYRLRFSDERSLHAKIDDKRSRPYVKLRTKKLTRVGSTPEATATIVAQVLDEPRTNHTRGCDRTRLNPYVVHAELEAAQPPTAGTMLGAATSLLGPGIADSIAEALAGLIQSLATPSASATIPIESHIPDPQFRSRAVASQVCRPDYPASWVGSASGTVRKGGVTETWTASDIRLKLGDASPGFAPYEATAGTISWSISGTNSNKCSLSGSASFFVAGSGGSGLTILDTKTDPFYALIIRKKLDKMATVTASGPSPCNNGTFSFLPLNADFATSEEPTIRAAKWTGGSALAGQRAYQAPHDDSTAVEWRWKLTAGS